MRILQIINSLNTGGAEKLILDTVPLYNKKGVVVDVLVFQNNDYPFHEKLLGTQTCKIYNLNVKSVYNPVSVFKMIRILKKYDIAHVHLFPAQYFVVLAKMLSFSKVKLVFTEHSTNNKRLQNKFFKAIDKWIYFFYTKIIAISNNIEAILKAHTDLNNQRIIVIENGVDVQQIMEAVSMDKTSIDKKISVTDTLILMVAGFKIPKDQETLIKAMVLLPQNVKLILAGDGPMKEKCVDLAIELGVAARVIFAGVRSDVPSLLKTVDLIVLSSNYEGMSLSCIEGMASGKPFLATDVPGLQELVSGYGVLFECGNVQDFANKITQFLTDEAYYNTVASACESRAKDFDIEQMIERHISLYKNII